MKIDQIETYAFGQRPPVIEKMTLACVAMVCALLAIAPRITAVNGNNPLKDAGFEMQLAPDQGGWILFDESRFSTERARTGRVSMFN